MLTSAIYVASKNRFNIRFLRLVVSGLSNGAIRSIRLVVEPAGVRRGQSATLRCLYDLDGAPLLSLQFYRGSGEFYRYSPMQSPTKKVFQFSGITVDVSILHRAMTAARKASELRSRPTDTLKTVKFIIRFVGEKFPRTMELSLLAYGLFTFISTLFLRLPKILRINSRLH